MENKENIVDKINNDDNKIVITTKSVKWIISILAGAVLSILSFSWGLYLSSQADSQTKYDSIVKMITDLEEDEVKGNTNINNNQAVDIGRLYGRTDSRNVVNDNATRPASLEGPNL